MVAIHYHVLFRVIMMMIGRIIKKEYYRIFYLRIRDDIKKSENINTNNDR